MVVALCVVSLAMIAGGLAAVYFGSDIIVLERGWTMVISGTVAAASGALLAGLAAAVARLRRIEDEFAKLRERLTRLDAPFPAPRALAPAIGEAAAAPIVAPAKERATAPEPVLTARREAAGPLPGDGVAPPQHEAESVAAETEAEPGKPADEPSAESQAASEIVGTYNSGGNSYVMYSDGSIEAETPSGKFRFGSLDELKEFIASGGDRAKAATPA